MAYIDGFVIAAPATRRQEVVDYAARFDPLFLEVGATRVVECWGDDVPHGTLTDFHRAVAAVLAPRCAPDGPIVAIGLDPGLEIDLTCGLHRLGPRLLLHLQPALQRIRQSRQSAGCSLRQDPRALTAAGDQ